MPGFMSDGWIECPVCSPFHRQEPRANQAHRHQSEEDGGGRRRGTGQQCCGGGGAVAVHALACNATGCGWFWGGWQGNSSYHPSVLLW